MQEKILIIWDVMIDKYTFWEVKRLNPEGPNPLLNVINEELRLWGSANVAANISGLENVWELQKNVWEWRRMSENEIECPRIENNVFLIGLVGKDENAKILDNLCRKYWINFKWIEIDNFHTIVKQRFVETTYNQQLLRVDYEYTEEVGKSSEEIWKNILNTIKKFKPKVIVVSDYNKWIVQKDWIDEIKKIAQEENILLLADSKPKNHQLFANFYLIKPNFKEFCEMVWKNIKNENKEIEKYWIEFVKKMNTNLIITRGAKWASLITKDWKYYHLETEAKKVFDVSWAWDTFIATIAWALANNYNLIDAVKLANKASGIVVGKLWTAVISRKELFSK